MRPIVKWFFDEPTHTFSYVIRDPESKACAIIDSVLNFDYPSGAITTDSADEIVQYVSSHGLQVEWILETHVHADHLSAAPYLKELLGGQIGIGSNIRLVQETFGKVFNEGTEFARDGSQFDALFADQDVIRIGQLEGIAIHTPGHTPACMSYRFDDACFVGDTLFMPDYGTARCDFPGGDAQTLYQSIQRLLSMPDHVVLFMCHDYGAPGRENYVCQTTVGEERLSNIHVNMNVSQKEFVNMRTERDKSLGMPYLMMPSVQINMRAGHLPPEEDNQQYYLKIPLNLFN